MCVIVSGACHAQAWCGTWRAMQELFLPFIARYIRARVYVAGSMRRRAWPSAILIAMSLRALPKGCALTNGGFVGAMLVSLGKRAFASDASVHLSHWGRILVNSTSQIFQFSRQGRHTFPTVGHEYRLAHHPLAEHAAIAQHG